jgi:hypothetical protein
MADFTVADYSAYNDSDNDEHKIDNKKHIVPCRICLDIYARVRLTLRYCNSCKRAFCEGEHGNFTGRGPAVCVRCFSRAVMQLKPN